MVLSFELWSWWVDGRDCGCLVEAVDWCLRLRNHPFFYCLGIESINARVNDIRLERLVLPIEALGELMFVMWSEY